MADLELTYRGYAVRFAENQDVWRCWSLDVEAEKLATVKAKIDRVIAAARKLDNPIPAMHLTYQDSVQPVRIMALAQPGKTRGGEEKEPSHAWCMRPDQERYFDHEAKEYRYRDCEKREKLGLDRLYQDTPENRAIIDEAARLAAEIKRLTEKRNAALKGMSRVATAVFKIEDAAEGESA